MNYSNVLRSLSMQRQSIKAVWRLLFMFVIVFTSTSLLAQKTVTGKVSGPDGEGIPSASVVLKGTAQGTITDIDGNFSLSVPNENAVLVISYVGYTTQEIPVGAQSVINVQLAEGATLSEVVVIGYGTQKKKDLTGAVTSLSSENFQSGNIATLEQLANGKLAGVQITTGGGAPGSAARIRIRGGASLSASNDPLIVIDGVPLDNNTISGAANPLSFINPNDIETFTVLKDASATAIYGSRASNGVLLITTKKGTKTGATKFTFSSMLSSATKTKNVDVLTGDEFRALVNSKGTAEQKKLLGTVNTNWQDVIYRTAYSSDNNLGATGNIGGMPYRASIGYLNQNGILLNDAMNRTSTSVGISPKLFDDKLSIDVNYKGAYIKNKFANQGAIGSAVAFDPTQPVKSGNDVFGGYYEWLDNNKIPNTLATKNPLGLLETRKDESTVKRHLANAQFRYDLPFLKGLRANMNVALDISDSDGFRYVDSTVASEYTRQGVDSKYTQKKNNKTFQFYLDYSKDMGDNHFDIMGGYEYQDFLREGTDLDKTLRGEIKNNTRYKTQSTLVSFYGRANYSLKNKYLLTGTLRRDGSSKFNSDNRWGLFPSVALAWRVSEEAFLKNSGYDVKLRAGWGVTGQQDITTNDYPALARYTIGEPTAQYQLGNTFTTTLRPEAYDQNIKWEETTTQNVGLDFGAANGRVTASIDVYSRKTKDLINFISVPAGSNLSNAILTNVGNMENKGVELTLNLIPVKTQAINWDVNFNITYNQNKITKLTKVDDATSPGVLTGDISGGVGNKIQVHSIGYPRGTFYILKQVYDAAGKPIEGLYADNNTDSKSSLDDRYRYKQPDPRIFLGFSSNLSISDFTLGFVLRGNIDNYVYNNVNSSNGVFRQSSNPFLNNSVRNVLTTGFGNNQYFSDYYMENGSFLRMDNLSLGYNLTNLIKSKNITAQVSLVAQNVFVITKYTGLDPEIAGGIDNNFYPRPRTISLGINLGF